MSSKRVHFASTNRVYSPIPTTPSPCASTSSLPSTPDLPPTPPEVDIDFDAGNQYPRSPYPHNQFELFLDVEPKDMHIHSFLAFSPYQELATAYDLSQPITVIKQQHPPQTLMEAATQPPLQYLTLVCPEHLPWDIPVKASSVYPGSYVTVDDVLTAIYTHLRLTVNPMEYDRLDPQSKHLVDQAYFARVARADPALREVEAKKVVKRVDFLKGVNLFMGLSGTLGGSDVWELNVS
ncbi:hypothetical protein MD484_g4643, partial [Candolleomyces efflorescens]